MNNNLSVILIAHNEETNIGRMISGLLENYNKEILEIIVVDDVSTDRTALVVESLMEQKSKIKIIQRISPPGVGRALKAGFKSVNPKADYILTMDSDFVENINEVRYLIDKIEKGYDGIIGSRFMEGSRLVGYPPIKKITNKLYRIILKALFNIKQKDLTNNFKLYKKQIFQDSPWESNDFSVNAETVILPIIRGYNLKEVPVSWIKRSPCMGRSKFKMYKHVWGYINVIAFVWRFLNSKKHC